MKKGLTSLLGISLTTRPQMGRLVQFRFRQSLAATNFFNPGIRCFSNKNTNPNKLGGNQQPDPKSEEAAMAGAKEFMEQQKSIVDELKDVSEFTTKVMHADRPVILDCYAE